MWENGDPPSTDENCRCWAEPFIDGAGIPTINANWGVVAGLLAAIAKILGRVGRRGTPPRKPSPPPSPKPVDKLPAEKPKDDLTVHGTERASGRNISKESIENAIKTAKEKGNVTTQTGKYGTPQNVYKGNNGVTVVVETSGRNAGKVITVWPTK